MLETIKEQAVTISDLIREIEDLHDIRIRANDEINRLNNEVQDLKYKLWENGIEDEE
jgi:hypothetical protein